MAFCSAGSDSPTGKKLQKIQKIKEILQARPKNVKTTESLKVAGPGQGTWTVLTNPPPFDGTFTGGGFPILLTDGGVLIHNTNVPQTGTIYKLTPDQTGSYINGTWSQLATPMEGYSPFYFAQAVLPDSRVVNIGGEYNGPDGEFEFTNLGAIYNPVNDTWTPLRPPPFFTPLTVGDIMLTTNQTGVGPFLAIPTLATGNLHNVDYPIVTEGKVAAPDVTACTTPLESMAGKIGVFIRNGTCNSLTNIPNAENAGAVATIFGSDRGAPYQVSGPPSQSKFSAMISTDDCNTLIAAINAHPTMLITIVAPLLSPAGIGDAASVVLPNGTFMLQGPRSKQAALLDAKTLTWTETGTETKFDRNDEEGWTLLPNSKVLTVNCYTEYTPANPPPSLTGAQTYDPCTGNWGAVSDTIVQMSDFGDTYEMGPVALRPDGKTIAFGALPANAEYDYKTDTWKPIASFPVAPEGPLRCADAPATVLRNGNILVATSASFTDGPTHFFEYTFKTNEFVAQPDTIDAEFIPAFYNNLLLLPTGQVLNTNFGNNISIYTPADNSYNPEWAPVVKCAPCKIRLNGTYKIRGVRLNGMTQANFYGDDIQMASNYPLVRITNLSTNHVQYARTHTFSYMGVASDKLVSTLFDVPANLELGNAKLEVVTNGIPSQAILIKVKNLGC